MANWTFTPTKKEEPQVPSASEPMMPGLSPPETWTFIPSAPKRERAFDRNSIFAPTEPVIDMFQGFNEVLGDAIGRTLQKNENAVSEVNQFAGWLTGKKFHEKPYDAQQAVRDFMDDMKLTNYDAAPISALAKDIGPETFTQLMTGFAMIAAAPEFAAIQAPGVISQLMKRAGEWMMKNPERMLISNIGSGAGLQVLGGEHGVFPNNILAQVAGAGLGSGAGAAELLPMAGRTIGGGIGSVVGGGVGMLGGVPGAGIGMITGASSGMRMGQNAAEWMLQFGVPMEKVALIGKNLPQEATGHARALVAAERARIQKDLFDAHESLTVGRPADMHNDASALKTVIKKGYNTAQERASQLWKRVNQLLPVDVMQTRLAIAAIRKDNALSVPENLPLDVIKKIEALENPNATKAALPRYGQPPSVSRTKIIPANIKEVRAIQSDIMTKLRGENGVLPSDTQSRYLNILHKSLDDALKNSNPNDLSLATAREYTEWLHDTFTRGPLGKFIGRRQAKSVAEARGEIDAAKLMLRNENSGTMLADAQARLNMPELEQNASAFVKSYMEEEFSQYTPDKAARLMQSPYMQRFLQAFPKVKSEVDAVASMMRGAVEDEKALTKSAFAVYADKDAQEAVRGLFSGGRKVRQVMDIKYGYTNSKGETVGGLLDNADAYHGWQDGVMEEFYMRTGGSPLKMQEVLSIKDYRDMLAEVLGPEKFTRFDRMVRTGARIERRGELTGRQTLHGRAFRILGSTVASTFGFKTLASQGAGGAIAKSFGETLTREIPAQTLFTKAIHDPKWERLLNSRVPTTMRELLQMQELMQDLVGATRAAKAGVESRERER